MHNFLFMEAQEALKNNDKTQALNIFNLAKKKYPELSEIIDLNIKRISNVLGENNMSSLLDSSQLKDSIDIVVPVFNALDDVKKCLDSLFFHNDGLANVKIIAVNDGSNEETSAWLEKWFADKPQHQLIVHPKNLGYTKAVNTGLRAATANYVITQNSDTIVSDGWLLGLLKCMNSDAKVGVVGPLSNAASWQTVPVLRDKQNGGFLINEIPDGLPLEDFARIVKDSSLRLYPKLPFINGFCFMIKRDVLDKIGYMDEDNFPVGYGEENDFCIRAVDAGYDLAVADDVYVFHAKSKSFGHERRNVLSQQGTDNLKRKHGVQKYSERVERVKDTKVLDIVRRNIADALQNKKTNLSKVNVTNLSILFVLPVSGDGGGIHSIIQETRAMRSFGLDVKVITHATHLDKYLSNYPDIQDIDQLVICFSDINELIHTARSYDYIVATIYSSVEIVRRIQLKYPEKLYAYYVQDYEPLFFDKGTEKYNKAYASYQTLDNALTFAKTKWILDQLKEQHGVIGFKVKPSIDHDVYRLNYNKKNNDFVISAMIRPTSIRRGALRTMRLLKDLKHYFRDEIKIIIFGSEENEEFFAQTECDFEYENRGVLIREEVAEVLQVSSIFLDLSDYQAFGRTALEAMACGAISVITKHGGADEYVIDNENALLIDPFSEYETFNKVKDLILNMPKLTKMQIQGTLTASNYSVKSAALSEIAMFVDFAQKNNYILAQKEQLRRVAIMPVLRGDKKPAGSGHVRLIYPYIKQMFEGFDVAPNHLINLPSPGQFDVVIMQRDMAHIKLEDFYKWLPQWKKSGGTYVYDIDDDMTDVDGIIERTGRTHESAMELVNKVIALAKEADLVTVSMPELKEVFLKYNSNVKVVYNRLDRNLWRMDVPERLDPAFIQKQNDPIRIGYIGTPTHTQDLLVIKDAVAQIKKEFGDKVVFEVVGAFTNDDDNFIGVKIPLPKNSEYPNFAGWLTKRINWDIGLVPLVDDKFNRSKSFLKFTEYSGLNLSIICSNVPSYNLIAKHEENALVTSNTSNEWYKAIKRLILDKELRLKLAKNSYDLLCSDYIIDIQKQDYIDVLSS